MTVSVQPLTSLLQPERWGTTLGAGLCSLLIVFCNATEIIGHYSGPEKLDEKDIILTEKKVNFSMGAANPMDKVSSAIVQDLPADVQRSS